MNRKKISARATNRSVDKIRRQLARLQSETILADAENTKQTLRDLGVQLRFYEGLDSYEVEFRNLVAKAAITYPSLEAVHVVSQTQLHKPNWKTLGYGHLQLINSEIDDAFAGYGEPSGDGLIFGKATFFRDKSGALKSVVLIRRVTETQDRDSYWGLRVSALYHELGHVQDAEQEIHLKNDGSVIDIVAAEAYAHCFALERLAEESMTLLYHEYHKEIIKASQLPGHNGLIGRRVIQTHPKRSLISHLDRMRTAVEQAEASESNDVALPGQ